MGSGGEASSGNRLGRRIVKALVTKEDHGHIHKMLGISVLLHFVYRFTQVGPVKDMSFGPTPRTLASISLHALLSSSSLIFRIPTRRIAEGSRIWPEYRLHSISFAFRSLACMLVTWLELRHKVASPYYVANGAIVIGTMLLADFGSWWVGPAGRSSTIQELDAPPFMRFFFSVMQFHATTGCLIGVRRFATQFFYVWIIQFTAFLMTLRRKNLAPHGPLVTTYGFMLTAGFVISTIDHTMHGSWLMAQNIATLAAVLRLGFGVNKYMLWGGLAVALHFARPYLVLEEGDGKSVGARVLVLAGLGAALFAIGVKKVKKYSKQAQAADAAAVKADTGDATADAGDVKAVKAQ